MSDSQDKKDDKSSANKAQQYKDPMMERYKVI